MLESAPGSSQWTSTMPPLVPERATCSRKSEATFTPFCFMAQIDRRPAIEAAKATSTATFSFTDHSTYMLRSRDARESCSIISDDGVPG